jgi:hypothetical protein
MFDEQAEWDWGASSNTEAEDVSEVFTVRWELASEAAKIVDEVPAEPYSPLADQGEQH